ncbi:hypothetical protein N9N67_00285 [Bacteriovoracaceae bacterium]|nr:hypothetical protein [Bacteriovoracaceae bacterium]
MIKFKIILLSLYLLSFSFKLSAMDEVQIEQIHVNSLKFTYKQASKILLSCYGELPVKKYFTSLDKVKLYKEHKNEQKSYEAYFYLSNMKKKGPFFISFNSKGDIVCDHAQSIFAPKGKEIINVKFESSDWVGSYLKELLGCWWRKNRIKETSVIRRIDHFRYDLIPNAETLVKLKFFFYDPKNLNELDGTATLSANRDSSISCDISDGEN